MGSCVSLSHSPPAPTTSPELGRRVAKVVDLDGSLARFEEPATARDALQATSGRPASSPSRSPPRFLCSSDELGFDAPARALAADEALQPGQLYFVLPARMLRRPLSGQEMAALAVKATRALAVEAGLAAGGSSPRRKGGERGAEAAGKVRRNTARVAPLLLAQSSSSEETSMSPDGASTKRHHGYEYDGERTLGKARHHGVVRGARRRRGAGGVQRLSAIAEGSDE